METTLTLNQQTVDRLQDLIEINRDSAEGFETAAQKVTSVHAATVFRQIAAERKAFAEELAGYVRLNGQKPSQDGSWKAMVHRWWIDLRASIADDDLAVVLDEAERGEDKIKAAYEETMKTIPGNPINDVLHRQYALVKRVHDRVRDARDRVKATS